MIVKDFYSHVHERILKLVIIYFSFCFDEMETLTFNHVAYLVFMHNLMLDMVLNITIEMYGARKKKKKRNKIRVPSIICCQI